MYVMGLDIGTTCTKALLTDEKGQVTSVESSGYPLISSGCRIEQCTSGKTYLPDEPAGVRYQKNA